MGRSLEALVLATRASAPMTVQPNRPRLSFLISGISMLTSDNRRRISIPSHDYSLRRKVEAAGYVIESGDAQTYRMRLDFPHGLRTTPWVS